MAGAVFDHPIASVLLERARTEISTYWTDAESGINVKGRIDIIPPGESDYGRCLIDLKSTIDGSPENMARAIHNLGYARQGGLYLSPFEDRDRFLIIAVEKTPPWAVAVYELSSNALAKGWSEAQGLLNLWSQCIENYDMNDLWPSYTPNGITELDLPPWAY